VNKENKCSGTARVLRELSEYVKLEDEYGEDVALTVTTKALQRSFPSIDCEDVRSTVKVIRAMQTGRVDVGMERQRMEDQAEKATVQLLQNISTIEIAQVENLREISRSMDSEVA
jgi:hypothetical protein